MQFGGVPSYKNPRQSLSPPRDVQPLRSGLGCNMTDLLLDDCYSCIIASLVLIKSLALQPNGERNIAVGVAAGLARACIVCVRSHEAGSVLPESIDRLAEESQRLIDVLKKSSINSPESTACSTACENFIRTYH